MNALKFAGVVVVYNPDKSVIDNIKTYIGELEKLYIVDNTEKNNSDFKNELSADLKSYCYEYILLGKNMGLGRALNIGIKKAEKEQYSWILTMDQDSNFQNNIMLLYKNYIEKNDIAKIALLSPQYSTERNKIKINSEVEEMYWTMQSASLFNIDIIKEIGYFREDFFIDCIDYEYCLRAREHGYKILRCNEAILNHTPAETKKIKIFGHFLKYGYAPPLRIYYQVRNAMFMYSEYKNIKSINIILIKLLKIILLFDNKKKYFHYFFKAISDYKNGKLGKLETL